jgi:hypothetical protein
MAVTSTNPLEAFQWTPQPKAAALVRCLVDELLAADPIAADLARRMREETGTRFIDWIDHLVIPQAHWATSELEPAGYVQERAQDGTVHFVQPHGMFPPIVSGSRLNAGLKVDSVADFAAANRLSLTSNEAPLSPPLSPLRRLEISHGLTVVERHGFRGYIAQPQSAQRCENMLRHLERLRTRRRDFQTDELGYEHARKLLDSAIADLGVDATCDLFFQAEREFWQRRNHAAQLQKSRQDKLGLGWGNHDHHTYRCSRENFPKLVAVFEILGFKCRERFYAGREAGWGAQVMEQPIAGIITFNDVDLTPDELTQDFAHHPLKVQSALGTVGLWCALHGDSFLQAGMHHLEAQFDFDSLREQLEAEHGVKTMKPFTNLPYLRQAFTEGERWKVADERIARVLSSGQITAAQAAQFREHGAIGSHLENLERNDGFKGFNQRGVNEIISATDPRKQLHPAGA